jgi:hypothetical protein
LLGGEIRLGEEAVFFFSEAEEKEERMMNKYKNIMMG